MLSRPYQDINVDIRDRCVDTGGPSNKVPPQGCSAGVGSVALRGKGGVWRRTEKSAIRLAADSGLSLALSGSNTAFRNLVGAVKAWKGKCHSHMFTIAARWDWCLTVSESFVLSRVCKTRLTTELMFPTVAESTNHRYLEIQPRTTDWRPPRCAKLHFRLMGSCHDRRAAGSAHVWLGKESKLCGLSLDLLEKIVMFSMH